MKELTQSRFCEQCEKETSHLVREDALTIEYICQECHIEEEIVKTFF